MLWDSLLLKAVTMVDSHMGPHGEAKSSFQDTLTYFVTAVPSETLDKIQALSFNSMNESFK